MVFLTLLGICVHCLLVTQHLRLNEPLNLLQDIKKSTGVDIALAFLLLILMIQPKAKIKPPIVCVLTITLEAQDNYTE